jgi:glycosyltransferase involved in cell wall biosynthesis
VYAGAKIIVDGLRMRKLRIFVISRFSQQTYQAKQKGFAGTSESRVLTGFVKNGHEVHLLMPREAGAPKDYSYSGIYVHEFRMPSIPPKNDLLSRLLETLSYYFCYFLYIILCMKRFMDVVKIYGKPDVVYGYAYFGDAVAYIVSRLYRVPNITRLYGTTLYTHISDLRRLLAGDCLQLLSFKLPCKYLIITNDGTRGDETARRLKVPSERVIYWMNGVDFVHDTKINLTNLRKELEIPQQAHIIVSVCRLAKWKRIDRLIRAVPEIAQTHSNVKVLLIGDGEEKENLQRLSNTLGLNGSVDFLGAIAHKDVEKYLRVADLFVSLYDYSNVSSSLLEAMTCGVCIVALNSGGTSKVIRNWENGILVSYDDLEKLPSMIVRLLSDEKLRRRLGKKARKYAVENFGSWDERVAMEVQLIERMIE